MGWARFLEWCSDADRYPDIPWLNEYGILVYRRIPDEEEYDHEY